MEEVTETREIEESGGILLRPGNNIYAAPKDASLDKSMAGMRALLAWPPSYDDWLSRFILWSIDAHRYTKAESLMRDEEPASLPPASISMFWSEEAFDVLIEVFLGNKFICAVQGADDSGCYDLCFDLLRTHLQSDFEFLPFEGGDSRTLRTLTDVLRGKVAKIEVSGRKDPDVLRFTEVDIRLFPVDGAEVEVIRFHPGIDPRSFMARIVSRVEVMGAKSKFGIE